MDLRERVLGQASTPYGRTAVVGGALFASVCAALASGALILPALGSQVAPDAAPPAASASVSEFPSPVVSSPSPSQPSTGAARPADEFRDWAEGVSRKVDIPAPALQAYAYAEWVMSQTKPSCRLRWTTLAAIAAVQSDHGRRDGNVLHPEGYSERPIVGPALDGSHGRASVPDTDGGALDGDSKWDHAIGPFQIRPSTWRGYRVDADSDQLADPFDVDDAAVAAAALLCHAGTDLSQAAAWRQAIAGFDGLSGKEKVTAVFERAQEYGSRSRQ